MRFTLNGGLRMLCVGMALWEGYSLLREKRREEGEPKRTLKNPSFLGGFFLICGVFCLAIAWFAQEQGVFFSVFSILILYAALVVTNQRLTWDDQGFWYRTALGREARYEYADVKGMGALGSVLSLDLWVRVGGRLFLLDSATGWTAFAEAYSQWQAQSGLPDWWEARENAAREKYRRMGPFRRNLSRVPGGMAFLVFTSLGGTFITIVSVIAMLEIRNVWQALMCVAMLAFGLYCGLAFPYAVAHLEDKPHLIHRFIHMPLHRRGDGRRERYRRKK